VILRHHIRGIVRKLPFVVFIERLQPGAGGHSTRRRQAVRSTMVAPSACLMVDPRRIAAGLIGWRRDYWACAAGPSAIVSVRRSIWRGSMP
jgi:hypothetical protein